VTAWEPLVLRPSDVPGTDRGSGARTVPLVTRARGATGFLNGITSFEPGAVIAHHTHNVLESVMIVQGDAIVDIDGVRTRLRASDTTLVPANIPHHFENTSDSAPMWIFWTYASVEATRTLTESGTSSRIDAEHPEAAQAPADPVHEIARITVQAGREAAFEAAVAAAVPLFQGTHGARSLVLEQSCERPGEYRLVVGWDSIDDHLRTFRESPAFTQWRALIADCVAGPPEVEHVRHVLTGF
jgi:quercetin dioxygenase-like cupin family protein/quinol monooxygenase YgiN